jgi:hypothetical protein
MLLALHTVTAAAATGAAGVRWLAKWYGHTHYA